MSEIQMCSLVEGRPAVAEYRWPWAKPEIPIAELDPGDGGFCSHEGMTLLRQKEKNLKRSVEIIMLSDKEAEPPLERSERQNLIAAKLAAEGECEDANRRSSELYENNVRLTSDLKNALAREEALKGTVDQLKKTIRKREEDVARLSSTNGELVRDMEKANTLLEADNNAGAEVKSLQNQLRKATEEASSLRSELGEQADKHQLKVAELERKLEEATKGQPKPPEGS